MTPSPNGSISGEEPFRGFEMLTGRLFGGEDSWPPARPGVQRVDIGRLLSEAARDMLSRAARFAAERGAADLDVLDLLEAAAGTDPAGALLSRAGVNHEELAERIAAALPPGRTAGPPATLSPAAKRVFLDAQRIGRTLRAPYIGPEHLLLALTANPGSAAARVLKDAGVTAQALRETLATAQEPPASRLYPYGRDLTEEAREGRLDPVAGREDEIEQAIEVLSRRGRNNPVLIGEPGVGKTAIVEGIAQRIVNGGVPETLRNRRVVALDLSGMTEDGMRKVVDEIRPHGDGLVVFIDDVHTLTGLAPALARGDLHVIAATPPDHYREHIEGDAVLRRCFQPIPVREPTVVETVRILSCLRDRYEAYHQVRITEDALDAAAGMSDRHICDRFLPDKAIDVMDQACSRVRLRALTPRKDARELGERLEDLRREKAQAVAGEDYERAWELREEIGRLRPECEAVRPGDGPVPQVTPRDVAEVVSQRTGVPVSLLTEEERDRLVRLEQYLHERVVGQDEAVRTVAESVRRARAGLSEPDRPIGSFLFLGPAGAGRTELARALAVALFGGEDHLISLDLGESGDMGELAAAVRRRPHSVVLLTAIEKARQETLHEVLRILEHGRLDDPHGRLVDFTHAIVIMTSDLGSRLILDHEGDADELREPIDALLLRVLRPGFVRGLDEVVVFRRLERDQIRQIAGLLLDRTRRRLRAQNILLEVTGEAMDWLTDRGHTPEVGARTLRRTVRRELDTRVSTLLINGQIGPGDTVVVDAEDGELDIQVRMPLPDGDDGDDGDDNDDKEEEAVAAGT